MGFEKGKSGNPQGRPKGVATKQTKLRAQIEKSVPGILAKTIELAEAGDTIAIKILLDRVLPALKPTDSPVSLPLGEGLIEDGNRVLVAAGTGSITPDQAGKLLQGLGTLARIEEIAELKERVRALEHILKGRDKP